jgi:uncharacterized membrane protein YoaK (UPF0700 family)
VDAISFLGLGRVFTANMTGNLVLLGLAAGSASGAEVLRSAVSLAAFVAGVFATARIAHRDATQHSWPPGVRVVLGCELLAQCVFLGGWLAASGRPDAALEVGLVALSALAMGLQSGAVRALGVGGVSTTYITGMLTGLIGQVAGTPGSGHDKARRSLVLVALTVGAACSGLLVVHARRLAPILPAAVTLVVTVTAVYVSGNPEAPAPTTGFHPGR